MESGLPYVKPEPGDAERVREPNLNSSDQPSLSFSEHTTFNGMAASTQAVAARARAALIYAAGDETCRTDRPGEPA
jgi:hypothetical protein